MQLRVPYFKPVTSADGVPAPGASVTLYRRGTTTVQPIYAASSGGSALSQPRSPDLDGRLNVWVEPGRYTVVINNNGLVSVEEWEAFPNTTETWTALTLAGAWAAVAGYPTPGVLITTEGTVVLRGVVNGGAAASTITTLPAGYTPFQTLPFVPVVSIGGGSSTQAFVTIATSGVITADSIGSSGNLSLDSIRFGAA